MDHNQFFALGRHVSVQIVAAGLLGFGLGSTHHLQASLLSSELCDENFTLLSPLLRCQPAEQKKEFVEFKSQLDSFIDEAIAEGEAATVSIYFRDLENGPWFGIGEQELFSPASMIKLPLLVALYKRSESDPDIFSREITIDGAIPEDTDGISPGKPLSSGEAHTVEELVHSMIIDSNNAALPILFAYLKQFYPDEDVFADTLTAMGISMTEGSENDFMPVKRYASIYRILYNASFLNKEMSQSVLELLTKTRSPLGIDDGVPAGIPVAHKFGVREQFSTHQMHDCGIVYYPENHYLLCIMTRGDDNTKLSILISEIAALVHNEVVERNSI